MSKKILVANWKEYGTKAQLDAWINQIALQKQAISDNKVILCPPLTLLSIASDLVVNGGLPISIGAQNVSRFEEGKYTGEVSAEMIAEFASYVIVGHSERRQDLGETDATVAKKVTFLNAAKLTSIVCVSEVSQVIALRNLVGTYEDIIAYEPLFAIGTGNPDTPENASEMAKKIKNIFPNTQVIYGGSVDDSNLKGFLQQEHISGVLVGNRSLDGSFFLEIVRQACFLASSKVKNAR